MDWSAGPAALGGIMMCAALGGWSLGRWQALPASAIKSRGRAGKRTVPVVPARAPAEPPQQASRAERRLLIASTDQLGELHAEVSAYRRAEAVLAELSGDFVPLLATYERAARDEQIARIMDEPTCDKTCNHAAPTPAAATMPPLRATQPSAGGEGTRV